MPHLRGAVSSPERVAIRPRPSAAATPRGRILGNGRYRALLTSSGTGGAWLGEQALTSWRGDRIEDEDGWFVYIRDLEDGAFWSLGDRPVPVAAEAYDVEDGPGWMAFARRDRGIASRMVVWVDADAAVECRTITLHNLTDRPRTLDLTSYLEVVLNDSRHHAAHPGFSKLFVQTEFLPDRGVLVARRRPRGAEERHPWLVHAARSEGLLSHESDRGRFLGRGRGPEAPHALVSRAPLSGTTGDVLDPVLALRRIVDLPPGATARLDLLLAAAAGREEALSIADRLTDHVTFETSHDRCVALAARRLADHGLDAQDGERLERLAVAILYRDPALRPAGEMLPALGATSFERDAPIPLRGPLVLVEAGAPASTVSRARAAHAYWRTLGLTTTLVIQGDGPASSATASEAGPNPGIFVLGAGETDARDLARLRARADLVLGDRFPAMELGSAVDGAGTAGGAKAALEGDVDPGLRRRRPSRQPAGAPVAEGAQDGLHGWPLGDEPLRCFNGWGGFNARGDEYVIRMPQDPSGAPRLTPRPWINVLASPGFGALISESGAGCTWSRNSREFRLTPWSNDPVRDPHDEALYLMDEESGLLWSAFPGPIPGDGPYEMRHGFGYSRCRHASAGLEIETGVFVHESDPVKVVEVRISNRGAGGRRLSVVAYQRLLLGHEPGQAARTVTTWAEDAEGILYARTSGSADFADAVAFAATVLPAGAGPVALGADREQFLGPGGSPARPAALLSGAGPDGRTGAGLDPCFCQQVRLDIGAGETVACAFLLGEAPAIETIEALVRRLRRPGAIASALDDVAARWAEGLGRVRIETPVESLDLLANGWLAYQTLACRLWARTAFYQSGGAFGFRDQLQDAAAFLALEPRITRDQILIHCARQFAEGDVLHWWHPPRGQGIRTRFADDLLWLPFVAASYVRVTGDVGLLAESVPFLKARALGPSEDEALVLPEQAGETADVYEHCCRAIDRSLETGSRGLPLFGSGDWNDGMNRVGREGRGESVWMGFFLFAVIGEFIPLCEGRGDGARAARLRAHQERLSAALEHAGWDGEWYRRGYYDDGSPLGSRESDECRIDGLVQAWSVLSGAAPRARCEQAMDAAERDLISWEDGLVRLLMPPFDRTPHDPGYIKGYVPGVRENGGQYTHAALWVVAAMARLGRRDQAARLLERISPIAHARGPGDAEVYQVEPYVVAADVYANPQHHGRGGWTWYTGSAGWMLRVTIESVLGVTVEDGRTLVVRAAIPCGWPGFRLKLRPLGRSGTYTVAVRNTSSAAAQVVGVRLDGTPIPPDHGVARVPLVDDGLDHGVEIELR